ncbi:hypothetical protein [Escherichia albertii]|uniref:hypothetical protein n=1 Tax=Escherichia albertii TaxID=208962 RepID=UPI0026DC3AB8|nr:hypothetical protein [Escherichia albertii]WKU83345.1 hypothetical protein MJ90_24910 [Escherichia albertii]
MALTTVTPVKHGTGIMLLSPQAGNILPPGHSGSEDRESDIRERQAVIPETVKPVSGAPGHTK